MIGTELSHYRILREIGDGPPAREKLIMAEDLQPNRQLGSRVDNGRRDLRQSPGS